MGYLTIGFLFTLIYGAFEDLDMPEAVACLLLWPLVILLLSFRGILRLIERN